MLDSVVDLYAYFLLLEIMFLLGPSDRFITINHIHKKTLFTYTVCTVNIYMYK